MKGRIMEQKRLYKEYVILGLVSLALIIVTSIFFLTRNNDTHKTVDHQSPRTLLSSNENEPITQSE